MRHLTTLKFIDAIARAGSIRGAAQRMSITPSALNRRLLAVEEEMDAPLFERLATGVRPSAAGELFLAHARRQMADMERIRSQVEDMKGARRGHVAFGVDNSLPIQSFSKIVGLYRDAHPEVTFAIERIDRAETQAAIASYQIDIAAVIQPEAFPSLTTLAVMPVEIKALMGQSHALAHKETISFQDLLHHPLVMPPPGSLRDLVDVTARKHGAEFRPALECELPFAQHWLNQGEAIGFYASVVDGTEIAPNELVSVSLQTHDLSRANLHLVQIRGRTLPVAASRFADQLVQHFAKCTGEM